MIFLVALLVALREINSCNPSYGLSRHIKFFMSGIKVRSGKKIFGRVEQVVADGVHHETCRVVYLQFSHDVFAVCANGVRAEAKHFRNFFITVSIGNEADDFHFTLRYFCPLA